MLAYKEDATHLISQALWVMNLLVSLRELLETHPYTGGWWTEPTLCFLHREDHCSEFWSPSASVPTNNSLSLQTFLWSALGKQWFPQYSPPVVPHSPVQDHGVKCRDEPFPGLRSGVLSCPLFTAACNSHRSYINWIWIKYTSTFAQTSSSSSLLVSRKT